MYDCLLRNLKHIRLLYVVNSKKMAAIGGDQKRIFIFYSKYVGVFSYREWFDYIIISDYEKNISF